MRIFNKQNNISVIIYPEIILDFVSLIVTNPYTQHISATLSLKLIT